VSNLYRNSSLCYFIRSSSRASCSAMRCDINSSSAAPEYAAGCSTSSRRFFLATAMRSSICARLGRMSGIGEISLAPFYRQELTLITPLNEGERIVDHCDDNVSALRFGANGGELLARLRIGSRFGLVHAVWSTLFPFLTTDTENEDGAGVFISLLDWLR